MADQHPADFGTEMFEREKDLSILEHVGNEIREVAQAIERVDAGTYGTCEDCGRHIAPARLLARPAARYCVEDQARRERLTSAS
jgi:RNA polymerase-binding transcription factor DksA